jgi:hypothetical protein
MIPPKDEPRQIGSNRVFSQIADGLRLSSASSSYFSTGGGRWVPLLSPLFFNLGNEYEGR